MGLKDIKTHPLPRIQELSGISLFWVCKAEWASPLKEATIAPYSGSTRIFIEGGRSRILKALGHFDSGIVVIGILLAHHCCPVICVLSFERMI